MKELNIIRHC